MDPINIIVAVNLFVSMSANFSAAKKGMKSRLSNVVIRPKTYLQKLPPNIAALVLILTIAAIFNVGSFTQKIKAEYFELRILGLIIFITFSWLQVYSFKNLGQYYSQDILIFKGHRLKEDGLYKFIRHPQYLCQILSDIGVGVALMGFIIIPIVLILEIPLFILRAKAEEKILANYFNDTYKNYQKRTGFIVPYLG